MGSSRAASVFQAPHIGLLDGAQAQDLPIRWPIACRGCKPATQGNAANTPASGAHRRSVCGLLRSEHKIVCTQLALPHRAGLPKDLPCAGNHCGCTACCTCYGRANPRSAAGFSLLAVRCCTTYSPDAARGLSVLDRQANTVARSHMHSEDVRLHVASIKNLGNTCFVNSILQVRRVHVSFERRSHWALELASTTDWQVQCAALCARATVGSLCHASWLRDLLPLQQPVRGLASAQALASAPAMLAHLQGAEAAVAQARQARRGFDEPPQTPLLAELRAVLQALAPQPGPRPRAVRPAALLFALRCGPSAPCGPPPCCLPSGAARARRAARRPAASPQVRPERCAAVSQAARRSLPCCWATGGACRSASMSCPAVAGLALAAPCPACRRCLAQRASCEPVDCRPAQPMLYSLQEWQRPPVARHPGHCCRAAAAESCCPRPCRPCKCVPCTDPACCMGAVTARSPESRSGQSSYARPHVLREWQCTPTCAVGWRRRAHAPVGLLQDGQQEDAAEALALLLGALTAEVCAAVPRPPHATDAQARRPYASMLRSGADAGACPASLRGALKQTDYSGTCLAA